MVRGSFLSALPVLPYLPAKVLPKSRLLAACLDSCDTLCTVILGAREVRPYHAVRSSCRQTLNRTRRRIHAPYRRARGHHAAVPRHDDLLGAGFDRRSTGLSV